MGFIFTPSIGFTNISFFGSFFTIGNFEIAINSEINVHLMIRLDFNSLSCSLRIDNRLEVHAFYFLKCVFIEFSLGGAFFWLLFSIFNHPGYVRLLLHTGPAIKRPSPIGRWYLILGKDRGINRS